jgi:hypothetical protein
VRWILHLMMVLAWALLIGTLVQISQASWEDLSGSPTPYMLYLPLICKPDDCAGEGEIISLLAGESCCPGLIMIEAAEPLPGGGCMATADIAVCTYCGDGACGLGENLCNCPVDC